MDIELNYEEYEKVLNAIKNIIKEALENPNSNAKFYDNKNKEINLRRK